MFVIYVRKRHVINSYTVAIGVLFEKLLIYNKIGIGSIMTRVLSYSLIELHGISREWIQAGISRKWIQRLLFLSWYIQVSSFVFLI